jgi:WD40 repeat protein
MLMLVRLFVVSVLISCATTPTAPPTGSGPVTGLQPPIVLNDADLVFAAAFSPDDADIAFTHHVSKSMELTSTRIDPVTPQFQQQINGSEFDCEDVLFATNRIVVVSKQGTVRAFDRTDGKPLQDTSLGEPLLRASLSPDGTLLAVASTRGRVFILDAKTLVVRGEARLHTDEVRGLKFLSNTSVLSASLDGNLVRTDLSPTAPAVARLMVGRSVGNTAIFLVHDGTGKAIAATWDARQPTTVVSRAASKRLGFAMTTPPSMVAVKAAEGDAQAPAVVVSRLRAQHLVLPQMTVGVCDSCVPANTEIVFGADVLAHVTITEDTAAGDVVLKTADGDTFAQFAADALLLTPAQTLALPASGNDVDVTADGKTAVVAFSKTRAERTFDMHQGEKDGVVGVASADSGVAVVDVATLAVRNKITSQHRGITSTAAFSPDGKLIVSGGWDNRIVLMNVDGSVITERKLEWILRRVRFSSSGQRFFAAAWTPANPFDEGRSEPSLLVYGLQR